MNLSHTLLRALFALGVACLIALATLAIAAPPEKQITPPPPVVPVSVTWERPDAPDLCWDFEFTDGRTALRFAAMTESLDTYGGVLVIRLGRECQLSGAF